MIKEILDIIPSIKSSCAEILKLSDKGQGHVSCVGCVVNKISNGKEQAFTARMIVRFKKQDNNNYNLSLLIKVEISQKGLKHQARTAHKHSTNHNQSH